MKKDGIKILAVDDSEDTLEILERNLTAEDYTVMTARSAGEAIEIIPAGKPDILITDWKMPKISGMELTRYIADNFPEIQTMMITGYATLEGAVEAVKTGAKEYLAKPFTEEELRKKVDKLAQTVRELRSRKESGEKLSRPDLPGIIWTSQTMEHLSEKIVRAASVPATVLITGESGTGKELVARAVHYLSGRSSAPFVSINCGAIPENLLESELFGYVKGAFTGAEGSRAGFFQTADGGTIFLDEISETSLLMQVKLLRVLQEREIYMVGSPKPCPIDVRVIAATNKDLPALIEKDRFREDLYYRLNVLTLDIPPLRNRKEDIPMLTDHFLAKFADAYGLEKPAIDPPAMAAFKSYPWPGNVRELENIVQRLVVMNSSGNISVSDLPETMRFTLDIPETELLPLDEMETRYIERILKAVEGNKTRAASILGIDRKTLREKLKKND
jgi:DNA-binding NtrC family response regulator